MSQRLRLSAVLLFLVLAPTGCVFAIGTGHDDDSPSLKKRVASLETRVTELEERVGATP